MGLTFDKSPPAGVAAINVRNIVTKSQLDEVLFYSRAAPTLMAHKHSRCLCEVLFSLMQRVGR